MDSSVVPSVLLVAVGAFSIGGAVADWDWFMEGQRARGFVKLFGRNGARVFYVLLGLVLTAIGVSTFPR